MSPGDVLNEVFVGYRSLGRYLATLSLILTLLVVAFAVVLVLTLGAVGAVASQIVAAVGGVWVVGLLVQTIRDLGEDDEDPWIGERFQRFWPCVNRVSVAALLFVVLFLPGAILAARGHALLGLALLVAAVVLLVQLTLTIPLIVIEGCSVPDALRGSHELVRGNGLPVFSVLLVVGVVTGVLSFGVERLVLAISDSLSGALIVGGVFDALVTTPLTALALASLYHTLAGIESAEPAVVAS
jgi:hypothetical protein